MSDPEIQEAPTPIGVPSPDASRSGLTRAGIKDVYPHQTGWYNLGIVVAIVAVTVLIIRAGWFSSL